MGYPLKNTTCFSLLEFLSDLQESITIYNNEPFFYFKPVIGLLKHPYLSDSDSQKLASEITKHNRIRIPTAFLNENEHLPVHWQNIFKSYS